MGTLYEINNELEQAINKMFLEVDEETGEVSQETIDLISELQMQKDEKLDNIGAYIKNLMADVKAMKEEEKALKTRREIKERKIERLKDYVSGILNGEKWEKSSRVSFTFRSSKSVIIDNEDLIPNEFMKEKIERSPDKTAIKKAIEDGQEVKGSHIEIKDNLQVK